MRLKGSPARVSVCHCSACQKRTGSAFGVGAYYMHDQVSIEGDSATYTRTGESGLLVQFHFCRTCGSTVFWLPAIRPHLFAVALGCFAGEKPARPAKQAHEEQRLDWVTLNVGEQGAT